jgi:hypothetical protein
MAVQLRVFAPGRTRPVEIKPFDREGAAWNYALGLLSGRAEVGTRAEIRKSGPGRPITLHRADETTVAWENPGNGHSDTISLCALRTVNAEVHRLAALQRDGQRVDQAEFERLCAIESRMQDRAASQGVWM